MLAKTVCIVLFVTAMLALAATFFFGALDAWGIAQPLAGVTLLIIVATIAVYPLALNEGPYWQTLKKYFF